MTDAASHAADWVIVLPVVLALMGAALLLMLRGLRVFHAGFAMLTVVGVLAATLELFRRVLVEGPVSVTMGNWLPPFGISFTADVMGAGFALVAAGLTLVLLVYGQMDRSGFDGREGFYPLVLMLLAGVSGAFLTGDLFNLYVWFEVMLIASFGLMILGGENIELDAAIKYGFLNLLATAFFLAALGLLYGLLGTLNMADIARVAPGAPPAALASATALFMLAFGMKAAAFPVNAWLPASYHAPSPVVSALLAGLLTKVGVYALLRTLVMVLPASAALLQPVIATVAILTLIMGPLGAIAETNLRRAVGFLLIGGIGATLAGMALTGERGIAGSIVYVVHAMATITALYCVAGLVERVTQETDTRRMGGVYAANSVLSVLFLVLILAIAGIPPLLGFWPKLLLVDAGVERMTGGGATDYAALGLTAAVLLNALLTLVAGTRIWAHIFWRSGPEGALSEGTNDRLRPLAAGEERFGLLTSVALVAAIVVAGLWPNLLFEAGGIAARDLLAPERYITAVGLGAAK